MGAIAGVVYPDVFQVTNLAAPMLSALSRRSSLPPRSYSWKRVQLGTIGQAVGANEKHSVLVILDGVVQNISALRTQLQGAGYHLATEDPAEVLVHCYDLWGIDFLKQLEGDFALALLDEHENILVLARDPIGKRPLYWYQDEHHFLFASELNALLATGAVPQTPAIDGVAMYLSLGYMAQDVSPIQGVNKLLPAHYLVFHLEGHVSIRPYWSYSSYFTETLSAPMDEVAHTLSNILQGSITCCCPDNMPVGCLVSGGLGSAAVAYYTTRCTDSDRVRAYSAGFLGESDADLQTAAEVASELRLSHKYEVVTQNTFLDDLVRIVWHLGEPIADPTTLVIWKLARLASSEARTVLSGMGADELLAGHSRYTSAEQQERYIPLLKRLLQESVRRYVVPAVQIVSQPWALSLLRESRTNPWQSAFLRSSTVFDEATVRRVSPALDGLFDPDTFLQKFHRLPEINSVVASYLYFDVKTRLPELYIQQYDRLMTAFGLEWQAPFLKKELVEFLAGLPEPEVLMQEQTASPLKQALRGHLSDAVIDRPKQSRPHFLSSWANTQSFCDALEQLKTGVCVDQGVVSGAWLKKNTESAALRQARFRQLWAILTLEVWLRLFINRPIRTTPPEGSLMDLLEE